MRNEMSLLVRVGLAIGSFVIYAVVAQGLNHPGLVQYDTERSSLAAAISNVVYGAPIGMIYKAVLSPLSDPSRPMQQTFEETARGEAQTSPLLKVATDGNGIGYLIIASLAMRVFGLHLSSLNFALLTLMAVSALGFLLRYRDGRLLIVPLYFFSLTVMLFTPLVANLLIASQIPIGGIRYFALVGILPAMHILLEIAEPLTAGSKTAIRNFILLGVQLLVLTTAVVVRSSAGYLIGAICVGFLLAVRTYASNRASLHIIVHKGTFAAVLGAIFLALFILWIPTDYKESGRTMGVVWHRVLISLGANPTWPFGKLRDVYQCYKHILEGLVPGIVDKNGHCIWVSYSLNRGLSTSEIVDGVYGGRYETIMERAFFDIVRSYPAQVLETFMYYKPMMFLSTMWQLMHVDIVGSSFGMKLLLFMQLLNIILFVACGSSDNLMGLLAGAIVQFFIFALLPMLVTWSNPHTSADQLFYFFAGLGIVLCAAMDGLRKFIRRLSSGILL